MTFDELRARLPDFGLALYAYEPGGPVTLEIVAPGEQPFSFEGGSEAAVIERAAAGLAPSDTAPPVSVVADEPADIFG